MSHPTEGDLRAFLDGETAEEETDRIREHLADCPTCREVRDELLRNQAVVQEALDRLGGEPDLAGARRAVRERLGDGAERFESRPDTGGWRRWGLLRVAALAVLFLGGLSAALPGSPVNAWLLRTLGGDAPAEAGSGADPGPPPQTGGGAEGADSPTGMGIRVEPRDGMIRIELTDVAPGTRVEIALVAGERAGISAARAEGFRSGSGVVGVTAPRDRVAIEVPRSVPTVEVRWGERVLLRKEDASLDFPTIMPESEGGAFVLTIPTADAGGDG